MDSIKEKNLKNRINDTSIIIFLCSILIFLILFAPAVLQYIKILPLLALTSISFFLVVKKMGIPLYYSVFLWLLTYIVINFLYLIKGTSDNLEIFKQLLPVSVIWPLLYTIAFILPTSKLEKVDFSKTFIFSTLAIEIFILYIYLNFIGFLPSIPLIDIPLGQTINFDFGFVNFFTPSITSLFFLLPYIFSNLLNSENTRQTKIYYIMLLFLGFIISLITGRRALILLVAISPFISIFWMKIANTKKINTKLLKVITITGVIIGISIILLSLANLGLRIQNLETAIIRSSNDLRVDQFSSLIEGWKQSPILGVGLGVNADVVRSTTVPGAYELSYVARLFQTGYLGIIVYFSLIFWLFRKLAIFAKHNQNNAVYIIPFLTGFTSLIIAEASNPYTSSFDGMWVFFFALAIINNLHLKQREY